MKYIPLTQGQQAIVDDEDFEWLSKWKWQAHWDPVLESYYAVRTDYTLGKKNKKRIIMHRVIMHALPGQYVDHIEHNTLDNRKEKLRLCTAGENKRNRIKYLKSSSIYKGISFHKRDKKFQAYINLNKKRYQLGYFDNEIEAAKAYDEAAKKYHGEFAHLNFPEGAGLCRKHI